MHVLQRAAQLSHPTEHGELGEGEAGGLPPLDGLLDVAARGELHHDVEIALVLWAAVPWCVAGKGPPPAPCPLPPVPAPSSVPRPHPCPLPPASSALCFLRMSHLEGAVVHDDVWMRERREDADFVLHLGRPSDGSASKSDLGSGFGFGSGSSLGSGSWL